MTNSALGLTVDASGVVLDDIGTSDHYANVASSDRWVITVYDTGIYSIQRNNNLGGYLTTEGSTANEHQLSTAATASTNTRWTFRKYTGEAIEGYGWNSAPTELLPGETVAYSAYMYTTELWCNGPVTYSITDQNGDPTICATINSSTGVLTTEMAGELQVRVLPYAESEWLGYKNVKIRFESGIVHTFRHLYGDQLMKPQSSDNASPIITIPFNSNASSCLWKIEYVGNEYYTIRNDVTGYYLTAPDSNEEDAEIIQTAYHPSRSLWRLNASDSMSFYLQSKNQYERTDAQSLYLDIGYYGQLVQGTAKFKWFIHPLTIRLNVLYDQSLVDRFGANYTNILQGVFSDNSNGISIAEVFKENFGIALRVTYTSTTYQSYPYAQDCTHKNELDTICYDCKNAGIGTQEAECCAGLHHKGEVNILNALPFSYLFDSTYIDILFTGFETCYTPTDDYGNIIGVHQSTAYAHGWATIGGSRILINTNTYYSDLTGSSNRKYNDLIKTAAHEILHNLSVNHCSGSDCIMNNPSYNAKINLTMCDACKSNANANKIWLYYQY